MARSDRQHAGDRRALLGRARARQAADPQLRDPRRLQRARLPARAGARGIAEALRRAAAGAGAGAHGDGARRDRPHGLQRLLPDRLGLRALRQGERHRRGARARFRRRLDRRLLPADHRCRSAALRPPVRALPEPRARVDARYRHRLLRARARAGDEIRDREVRARVGRADRHLRQDVPARSHPRRGAGAGLGLRHRRPSGEADPRSDHGSLAVIRGMPEAGAAAAQGVRRGAGREADHRRRAGSRGDRSQQLDPRRRGGDRRPPADRHRAAAARRRRRGRERRESVSHRHPVLDETDRGHRPFEDGLPRPAQPRRDRGRAGHHRALHGRATGLDHGPARRSEDLRDARPGRLDRRVPVRVRGHARGLEEGPPGRVQRPRRAQRALPPGRDGSDPGVCQGQAQPAVDLLSGRAPAADPRILQRGDPLPGAGDADLQGARRLLGSQGRRSAQGDRQEEPRRDGRAEARVRRGLSRLRDEVRGDRVPVADQRKVRRLLVQQEPRRLLRADRLPHRLVEGQLHRRVHGRADLLGDVDQGQGPVLRRPLRGDGDRDPAARREPLRPPVHRRCAKHARRDRQHPVRLGRRQGRRLPGRRGDQARRATRTASSPRYGISASGSTVAPSTRRRSRR